MPDRDDEADMKYLYQTHIYIIDCCITIAQKGKDGAKYYLQLA